jgi:plasmid stability protein
MALTLEKLPDELVERLRRLASEHGSDVQSEAIQCLEKGLSEREQIEADLKEIRELRAQSNGVWMTDELIRAARDEGRE